FIEVNSAGLSLLKCTHEDVLKMKIKDFILDEDLSIAAKYFEAQRMGETVLCEMRIKCKDGSVIQTETNAKRIADGRFQAIMRDITSRKREAENHIKVEKLESITILAGGIANDFNNLLTAILGNISLALLSTDSGNPAFHRLAAAEKASLRAQELTQQLLDFSKGRSPAKKEASIKNLLIEAARFASRGTSIKCDFHLSPDLWVVEVDEGQINQVINNLIINAVQASGEVEDSPPVNLLPGKYVRISIQDQGVGIPEENLTKIFDPYFTTKPTGSGLGLATSYSIIKKHGGEIIVTSRLNQGTTFSFYLPALDKISSDTVVQKEPLLRGTGRILLLDDEEDVLEVTAYMLKELGYEVALARDGTEVLSIYQNAMESKKPFAAVIMDLTIPGGMGGKEVLPKLLKMDSGVRAIASSGYFSEPVLANWKSYHFCSVLSKPYRLADLGKTLDQVLKKKDAAG
ncbi:MAG: response regulator, partial [Nitrospirae bacterium]|nr:response regulator [Nitrospirota bacterium]